MVEEMLHPGVVRVAHRRRTVRPPLVVPQLLATPVGDVEGRIGQDVVGPQVGVAIVAEAVAVLNLALDAPDCQVHPSHAPCRVVRLLPVDGDVATGPAAVAVAGGVCADELHRLDEHARRAAAGVVHAALVGLQHFHQEPHDRARGVELAPLTALCQCELLQEVLVDVAQHVRGACLFPAHFDVANEVDDLTQASLIQCRSGVVLGKHVVEHRVVPLDGGHGVVHQSADGGLAGLTLQILPPGLRRHPEDVLGTILVGMFRVRSLVTLGLKPCMGLFKSVGDVLQEDQTKDDVLVLGGVHAASQGVGHLPELGPVVGDAFAGPQCGPILRTSSPALCCGHCSTLVRSMCPRTVRAYDHR